jgi:hypothetical protein
LATVRLPRCAPTIFSLENARIPNRRHNRCFGS